MQAIPIYIINLKRNPERKLFMQRQLDTLGLKYSFVDVDIFDRHELRSKTYRNRIAKLLDIDEAVLERKCQAYKNRRWAGLAIMLSHIQIYNSMIKNDIPVACILEDDATLLPTFPEILKTTTKLEWDILMLASQPTGYHGNLIQLDYTKGMVFLQKMFTKMFSLGRKIGIPIFNEHLLFISKKTENCNAAKKQESRLELFLAKYGINARLRPEQSEIFAKILQEYDTKHAELIKTIAPDNRQLSLIKHEHYLRYRTLHEHLKTHTLIRLGALPDKSSLELITKHHCIAKPRNKPLSTTAYMLKQSVAMKWKQQALAENTLALDEIPSQLYKNEQVKLRLITPPCATATYHYLKYSTRRGANII